MKILAIETSCDETSMALVDFYGKDNQTLTIHSHLTASQVKLHEKYGGVFPAIAKLEHVKACIPLIKTVFDEAKESISKDSWVNIDLDNQKIERIKSILSRDPDLAENLIEFIKNNNFPKIDLIAVTNGPGLEIALWVGITFAKALSDVLDVPVVGVNHMMGHLFSGTLPENTLHKEIQLLPISENALSLLVSGGHTQLIHLEKDLNSNTESKYRFKLLGETVDDAVGEAYDKVARLLDLTYPGGPKISKLANIAREKQITPVDLPRPMIHSKDYNFSYSGLKTAVMYHLRKNPIPKDTDEINPDTQDAKLALALGFENAAIEVLVKKTKQALLETGSDMLLLGGGVAANTYLQSELIKISNELNTTLLNPLNTLTGDNALMIALAANYKYTKSSIKNEINELKAHGTMSIA